MESQHPVGWPTCHDFPRFLIISEISRPEVRSRWRRSPKSCLFGKKTPYTGKFSKMFSERIHADIDPRLVYKFREIWLTGSRQSRALFTSQKVKFRLAVPLSLLRGSRPKSVRASSRQYTRSAPNFIRMRTLRSELYIAVVNIVETRVTKCFQYSAMLRRVLTAIAWLGLTVSPRLLFICLSTISGRRH